MQMYIQCSDLPSCPMFDLNPYDRAVYLKAHIMWHSTFFSPCGLDLKQSLHTLVWTDMASWCHLHLPTPSLCLFPPVYSFILFSKQ